MVSQKETKKTNEVLKSQSYKIRRLILFFVLFLVVVGLTIYLTLLSNTPFNFKQTLNNKSLVSRYMKDINSYNQQIVEITEVISNYQKMIEEEQNYLNEFSLSREFANDINSFVSYVDIIASECNIEIKKIDIINDEQANKNNGISENSLNGYKKVNVIFRGLSSDLEIFLDKLYTREIVYIERFEINTDFDAVDVDILFSFYKGGEK